MPLKIAVVKENLSGERRVALDPGVAQRFIRLGAEIVIEQDAGMGACFADGDYGESVKVVANRQSLYQQADVVLTVNPPSLEEIADMKEGSVLLGFMQPYNHQDRLQKLAEKKITAFSVELIPRISRAQSMDALSSQASIAGYKAALMAATRAGFFFPMLTTAAGTIRPAKVVVIGAGVAGLQAIATCKRLGAQVQAYDIRAAAKEQVESLGARLIDTGVDASGEGGYARELTDEEKQQQAAVLAKHLAAARVVISTAAVPGRQAPKIISKAMVEAMQGGTVIVDMAAETGGNCELTKAGEDVEHGGVIILGPVNIPSSVPVHATEMYAKNLYNFLSPMIQDSELALNWEDEVIAASVVTHEGQVKFQQGGK